MMSRLTSVISGVWKYQSRICLNGLSVTCISTIIYKLYVSNGVCERIMVWLYCGHHRVVAAVCKKIGNI
jgi:hypothetical protein